MAQSHSRNGYTSLQSTLTIAHFTILPVCIGIIPPNRSITLEVTVHVQSSHAHALNTGTETLDEILVIRLENGRDYFVAVAGTFLRSCFGTSIDFLVNTLTPVRSSVIEVPGKKSMRPARKTIVSP